LTVDNNWRQQLRAWWRQQFGRTTSPVGNEAPGWLISLAFHLVLLVALAAVLIKRQTQESFTVVSQPQFEEQLVEVPQAVQFSYEVATDVGAQSAGGSSLGHSAAPILDTLVELERRDDAELADFGQVLVEDFAPQSVSTSVESIPTRGVAGEAALGAEGAIDRITHEILQSVEERNTVVVWLFDQSGSLSQQRQAIANRIDRIYDELTTIAASGNPAFQPRGDDPPLLTQVFAFGAGFQPLIRQPTTDVEQIRQAVRSIEVDDSGIENVFSSVVAIVDRFQALRRMNRTTGERRANVMIIIVSDEAGDDIGQLEAATTACKQSQIPVYVIGVPAPFGRAETLVKWVDPDPNYDQSPQWTPVHQGPESFFSENLKLNFIGVSEQDEDLLDSGFGPFGLTRLCYESGGIYFTVHPNRNTEREVSARETDNYTAYLRFFFDPQVMRRYRPDYVSADRYAEILRENKARRALVQAAEQSWIDPMTAPRLMFPRFDEAEFVTMVSEAQRAAASLEPKINLLYEILKSGESDRASEVVARWKAGYDLAMGRTLATKIRAETYNAMLAMAKTTLKFENERNNTWVLRPFDEVSTGTQAAKLAEQARTYLRRVIDEHPDTPWAYLAQRELETPIGWKWSETYLEPPRPPDMQMVNNAAQAPPAAAEQMPPPKQRRAPPKL